MNIAIILSGGTGSRMGLNIPKQYVQVNGKPIIRYCIEKFLYNTHIDCIIIGADINWIDYIKKSFNSIDIVKPIYFSPPGETRQHTIYNALKIAEQKKICQNNDIVIIHDAARPLVSDELISSCITEIEGYDGILPVLPVKDTLYTSIDGTQITSLLTRSEIFAGQAPESFLFGKYLKAHQDMSYEDICKINGSTEIAYKKHLKIRLIKGSEMNFKITTPEDLSNFENIINGNE